MSQEKQNVNTNESINSNVPPSIKTTDYESKNFFGRASEKAKDFLAEASNKIGNKVSENRLVGKMNIAYNQFWINKKEEKSARLKGKADSINLRTDSIDTSIASMKELAESLDKGGMPGSASLNIKIRDLEANKIKLLNRKGKILSKLEKRDNQISIFTNKRDAIADRFINRYEKKIAPINERLERLHDNRDNLDLVVIASEVRFEEQLARIEVLKLKKGEIEDALRSAGNSDRKVKNFEAIKQIDSFINNIYAKLEKEKVELNKRKEAIEKKIAKVDKKVAPYRDRKDEFIRVKSGRPVRVNIEKRSEAEEFKSKEKTNSNERVNKSELSSDNSSYSDSDESHKEQHYGSINNEKELNFEMGQLLGSYNTFIDKSDKASDYIKVDKQYLFKVAGLSDYTRISSTNFKKIIRQYYKINRIPESVYLETLNNFIK